MSCHRCKKEIDYRTERGGWFTGNGPGLPCTQMYVCEPCRVILEDEHTTAWAESIAGHFMLKTWYEPAIPSTEMIRRKVIKILQEGKAYVKPELSEG